MTQPRIALFDLDNTLLAGDSDYEWGCFLVAMGAVDKEEYTTKNNKFYADYRAGKLDIQEFLNFALQPLARYDRQTLVTWHAQFMQEKILPIMLPKAKKLIEHHRKRGDVLVIITATNHFVTAPIAQAFSVDHLIATDLEEKNGQYTGAYAGIPCFQDGKVIRLKFWLSKMGYSLSTSCFYSDSINDLPLLQRVSQPVAVDPDPLLRRHAEENKWLIISLREQ